MNLTLPVNSPSFKNVSRGSICTPKISHRLGLLVGNEKPTTPTTPSMEYLLVSNMGLAARKESIVSQESMTRPTRPDKENSYKTFGKRVAGVRPLTSARTSGIIGALEVRKDNQERRKTVEDVCLSGCLTQKKLVTPRMNGRNLKIDFEQRNLL